MDLPRAPLVLIRKLGLRNLIQLPKIFKNLKSDCAFIRAKALIPPRRMQPGCYFFSQNSTSWLFIKNAMFCAGKSAKTKNFSRLAKPSPKDNAHRRFFTIFNLNCQHPDKMFTVARFYRRIIIESLEQLLQHYLHVCYSTNWTTVTALIGRPLELYSNDCYSSNQTTVRALANVRSRASERSL